MASGGADVQGKMETMSVTEEVQHTVEDVWQNYVCNMDTLLDSFMPGHFESLKHVQGEPFAPGSYFVATYHKDMPHYEYVKGRWDEMDHEKHRFKCTIVDGGFLSTKFSHLIYYFSVTPASKPTSSIMSFDVEFVAIGDHSCHEVLEDEVRKVCKSLESHLNAVKAQQ